MDRAHRRADHRGRADRSNHGRLPTSSRRPGHSTTPAKWPRTAALILGIIDLILGVLGRGRAKRGEATNRTIAERGVAISTFAVAIWVFAAVRLVADLGEESVETGNTLLGDLEVGDCFADIPEVEEEVIYQSIDTVSCYEPHGAEIYAVVGLPEGTSPVMRPCSPRQ